MLGGAMRRSSFASTYPSLTSTGYKSGSGSITNGPDGTRRAHTRRRLMPDDGTIEQSLMLGCVRISSAEMKMTRP